MPCCCPECQTRDLNCEACTQCKPNHLCVTVLVTPGLDSDYSDCCLRFAFRLPMVCVSDPTHQHEYSGSGSCQDGVSLDIAVWLESGEQESESSSTNSSSSSHSSSSSSSSGGSSSSLSSAGDSSSSSTNSSSSSSSTSSSTIRHSQCRTRVRSSLFGSDFSDGDLFKYDKVYPGTLPVINFTVVNDAGDTLDVTIGSANVVPNPIIRELCSPCYCARCLPGALCVRIFVVPEYIAHTMCPTITDAKIIVVTAPYDCGEWVVEDGEITRTGSNENPACPAPDPVSYSMSIMLLAASTGICGVRVMGTLGGGSFNVIFAFEGGLHWRKYAGTLCRGDGGNITTLGTPKLRPCPPEDTECEDPDPQDFAFDINMSILVEDDEGRMIGIITIREAACGDCQYCPPEEEVICCDTEALSLTLTWAGCGSAVFIREPGLAAAPLIWAQDTGFDGDCVQLTPWAIICDGVNWILSRFTADGPDIELDVICDPFMLSSGDGTFTVTE